MSDMGEMETIRQEEMDQYTTGEVAMDDRWGAWAMTGGLVMIMVGSFRALAGFIGIFNDQWVVRGFTGYYFVDVSALAWWMFILGSFVALAGLAVLAGQTWARVVGVIAITLATISEFFWLPVYPIWSILMITLYVFIVIGLIAWNPVRD